MLSFKCKSDHSTEHFSVNVTDTCIILCIQDKYYSIVNRSIRATSKFIFYV